MTRTYRSGFVGALIDEFERASEELLTVLDGISEEEYERVRDTETQDESCRSIQTVFTHVVRAGYGHANLVRKAWGIDRRKWEGELIPRGEARNAVAGMVPYASATFDGRWNLSYEEAEALKMQSGWGTTYDLEQILEHMVTHVLRHRRQIERFLGW